MPEVSFYVLPSRSLQERYLFACKLIEKAYRSGHFCYVITDNAEQSQILNELLWTFRAGSFIPHQIFSGEPPDYPNTVLIGSMNAPPHWQKTLINLAAPCPENFQQAERILEVLDDNEENKEAGRQRYRRYQQSSIGITTHKINQQV